MTQVCPEGSYFLRLWQSDGKVCAEPRNLRGLFYNDTSGEMNEMTLPVMVVRLSNAALAESHSLMPLFVLLFATLHLLRLV